MMNEKKANQNLINPNKINESYIKDFENNQINPRGNNPWRVSKIRIKDHIKENRKERKENNMPKRKDKNSYRMQ